MKHLLQNTLLMAGLSALLGSFTGLSAQGTVLKADIPFAFHTQGLVLPAGTYAIRAEGGQGIYQFINPAGKVSGFVNAPIPRNYMPKDSKLTFARYGSEYVLSEISVAGAAHTSAVPPSVVEKNVTRKLGLAAMVSVPLQAR